jgi:hypothetical protein
MHRSVLEDDDFVTWANENIVVLVGNSNGSGKHKTGDEPKDDAKKDDKKGVAMPEEEGKGDPPKDEEPKDDPKPEEGEEPAGPAADVPCTYYPGIKCSEHVKAVQDVRKPPEGCPEVPDWKGIPATFLIAPDGTVEECKEDRAPSSLQGAVEDLQKRLKLKPLPFKKYGTYVKAIEDGDAAVADGKWKAALAAYAKVDKDAKKLPGLAGRLVPKVEALNAKVVEAFAKAKEEGDDAAKMKAVKALRAEVSARLSTGALPVVADLDAWIKENAPQPAKK